VVVLVADHAHKDKTAPRTTAATDATSATGRRRSFGGAPNIRLPASDLVGGRFSTLALVRIDTVHSLRMGAEARGS
jgi:hypothetical protein